MCAVMGMLDQGEKDDKIIAVHADDPEFRDFSDVSELPKHRLREIRRFCSFTFWAPVATACTLLTGLFRIQARPSLSIRVVAQVL